jgi:hypothetical protein
MSLPAPAGRSALPYQRAHNMPVLQPRRSRQAQTVITRSDQRGVAGRAEPGMHHATAAMVVKQMEAGEQLAEPDAIDAGKRPGIR